MTSTQLYLKRYALLPRYTMVVLEGLQRSNGEVDTTLSEITGLNRTQIYYVRKHLESLGLTEHSITKSWITEKGKIALAIWHGKEQFKRARITLR